MHNVPLLLGAQCSRYSARVRSYLIKKDIQYVERVPTLWTYRFAAKRRVGDMQIPILVMPDGRWLADSERVLDHLEVLHPENSIEPDDPVHRVFCTLAGIWGSEFWAPVDLITRWIHPENYPWWREELGEAFFPGLPKAIKNAGAGYVAKLIKAHLPRLGYSESSWPNTLRWAENMMDVLENHFTTHPYLLGERASRADFGLIVPFYGHLVQDPWSRRNLLHKRPHLHAWIWRMQQPYMSGRPPEFPAEGSPLPATLQPIVRSMFDELLPFLEAILDALLDRCPEARPGRKIPRMLGMVEHPIGDGKLTRIAIAHHLWLFQRALDQIRAMPAADAERAKAWLREAGGGRLLEIDIPRVDVCGLSIKFA